jgi:CBS domain
MTTTVRQMLTGKADVYAVNPDDTIYDALRLMAEKNIGAVLVTSGDAIEGILSERDYARKVVLLGPRDRSWPSRLGPGCQVDRRASSEECRGIFRRQAGFGRRRGDHAVGGLMAGQDVPELFVACARVPSRTLPSSYA